jgi:hypothetical protein
MMRRWVFVGSPAQCRAYSISSFFKGSGGANSSTGDHGRQDTTKTLTKVAQEFKGQALDLQDMCNASRVSLKECNDMVARLSKTDVDDATKHKVNAVVSSLKAYCVRLGTVQGEAHSINADMDAIIKGAWKKDTASGETPATTSSTTTTSAEPAPEIIVEAPEPVKKSTSANVIKETEIEVETTEKPQAADAAATMSVTEITEYLHEKGVDFGDCFDAASLRERYRQVVSGKYEDTAKKKKLEELEKRRQAEQKTDRQYQRQQVKDEYRQPPPPPAHAEPQMNYGGSQEQGLMQDPYPGAERKMVDPMKFVWEVKAEFCKQKGINPNQADMWCGFTILEDHKRLYEYPQCQRAAIEIKMKGDTRQNPAIKR